MSFKFEKLDVWQLALEYIETSYEIANRLPRSDDFNLKSQLTRAATSIALNIAEGSTGQSDAEQSRFLGIAIRSLIETVACLRIIENRSYLEKEALREADEKAQTLAKKLHTFRKSLSGSKRFREEATLYNSDDI